MRWPFTNWLRGGPGRDDPSPGAGEAAPNAPAPDNTATPDPGPRAEARPAAWRDLPPVQRAVGAAPLTAPSAAFARDLAGRRAPDPMLGPLGHDVTAGGPAGLVGGITVPLVQRTLAGPDARPAALPTPAAPGLGRPMAQRLVTSVVALPPRGAGEDAAGGAGEHVAGAAATESPTAGSTAEAPAAPAAAERPADVPGLALRTLPVARLATGSPAIAATRVADATAPAPVLALARAVVPGADATPASAGPAADAAIASDATDAAPDPRPDVAAAVPAALSRAEDPGHPVPGQPVVARRTLGESRRLGLGAPLAGRPPSAARETGRPDLPVARRARAADAPLPTPANVPAAPAVEPAAAASAPLPRLVVARRSTAAPPTTAAPATLRPLASPEEAVGRESAADEAAAGVSGDVTPEAPGGAATGGATAGGAASVARPLVGESRIGAARLAREDAGAADDAGVADELDGRALRQPGMSSIVSAAGRPGAGEPGWPSAVTIDSPGTGDTSGVAGRAAVQRAGAARGGDPPSSPVRPSVAMRTAPATAPLVAARLAVPAFGARGDAGDPGPASTSAGPAPKSAAGSTATNAIPAGRPAGVVSWAAGSGFTTVASSPGPFVQRAVEIDELMMAPDASPAGTEEAGPAAGPASRPGASAPGAGGAATDYEELAEHVYDRIRARLATELLLDRERAGLLVDG